FACLAIGVAGAAAGYALVRARRTTLEGARWLVVPDGDHDQHGRLSRCEPEPSGRLPAWFLIIAASYPRTGRGGAPPRGWRPIFSSTARRNRATRPISGHRRGAIRSGRRSLCTETGGRLPPGRPPGRILVPPYARRHAPAIRGRLAH